MTRGLLALAGRPSLARVALPERLRRALGARPPRSRSRALVLAFLAAFLLVPVATVFVTAFREGDGSFTLAHFATFFTNR